MALEALKPAASSRTHLLLAALLWTTVGLGLLYFGVRWTLGAARASAVWLLPLTVVAGLAKARYVLWSTAGKIVARIRSRGDGRCLGGFLSLRSWALVLVMVVGGRLLRGTVVPLSVAGPVYAAVGLALAVASTRLWAARAAP